METAAMWDSAKISRKEGLTLPPWVRTIATPLNSPDGILLRLGSSKPAGMSRRGYSAISCPPHHGNSATRRRFTEKTISRKEAMSHRRAKENRFIFLASSSTLRLCVKRFCSSRDFCAPLGRKRPTRCSATS
jgi:hypothetical protein